MSLTLIIQAFTEFMKAAAEYLRLRSLSYLEDLIDRKQKNRDDIVAQIEKLRATGKPDDAARADLLRDRLLENNNTLKYLLAQNSKSTAGGDDKN